MTGKKTPFFDFNMTVPLPSTIFLANHLNLAIDLVCSFHSSEQESSKKAVAKVSGNTQTDYYHHPPTRSG